MKKSFILFLFFLLLLFAFAAGAEGQDITKNCKFKMAGGSEHRAKLFDRMYKTVYQMRKGKTSKIEITLPKDFSEGGLYICWAELPSDYTLYLNDEEIHKKDEKNFYHEYIEFSGSGTLRLEVKAQKNKAAMIGELFVISGNEAPSWAQRWEDTKDRADILIMVAHPDDDVLFMGGAIPYYTSVEKKDLVIAYLTCANNMRRSEMLNCLWAMGVKNYPVVGSFQDKAFTSRAELYKSWGENRARNWVIELFRKYQPQVVLSHDVKGEYGHRAHKAAAELAIYAAEHSGDSSIHPESASKYGAHTIDKLYLHLYEENKIKLDWKKPYEELGGKSPLQIAEIGFKMHRSQQKNHSMGKSAVYDTEKFGLAFTSIGDDVEKNNFFENVSKRD